MEKGPLIGEGRTAQIYAWGEQQVLKLFRSECPVDWVDHEYRISRLVADAGVNAPAVGDIIEVEERRGILYQRIEGRSMLQILGKRPWLVRQFARQFAEVHAAMHGREAPALPAQKEALKRKIIEAPRLSAETKAKILAALDQLPSGNTVCHGDFHPDNILMAAAGPVVIDWTNATRGRPAADVARTILMMRYGAPPPQFGIFKRVLVDLLRAVFYSSYLRRYLKLHPTSPGELDAWLLPVAAARLTEGIVEEEDRLVNFVEDVLSR
jgi:uncharacterized protein (TIGR02172 family)